MRWILLVPILVGAITVFQSGLNKIISTRLSLLTAVSINSLLFLFTSLLCWFVYASNNWEKTMTELKQATYSPWYVLPGICGFLIVAGIPYSMGKIGSGKTFVLLIASQILFGLIWDISYEKKSFTLNQYIAAVICFASATWFTFSRE